MSSLPPDPYKILGVSKDAQIAEIRSAHRKLALKCHPDKVQDPTLKAQKQDEFQLVQQAYELLSDDKERSRYDDQIKLAELRKQKANMSTPRASPKFAAEFEVRTAEPRSTSFRSSPSSSRSHTYSRSWEDDYGSGPRIFEAEIRLKREPSGYSDKASKREMEKERELRDRDRDRERERERERERRRRVEEDARRIEKAAERMAKDFRKAEKKSREKQVTKERRRETDEKRRPPKPYIETYEEETLPPRVEKKKSSSKKYDEKRERERSAPREEVPVPPSPMPQERSYDHHLEYATSYIQRSKTYYAKPPAVPTPPPVAGQSSPFHTPDDEETHRSAAKARRGSADNIRLSREKTYRKSNERLDEPFVVDASQTTRHAAQFQRSSTSTPVRDSSPPRRELPRQNTTPAEPTFARGPPSISRSKTFNGMESSSPRGRSRSRFQPQIEEESESDDEYERRGRDRSARRRRGHSVEHTPAPEHNVRRYQVENSRATLYNSYSRRLDSDSESHGYASRSSGHRVVDPRPSLSREPSSRARFSKFKESRPYGPDDIQYSRHNIPPQYSHEYSTAARA